MLGKKLLQVELKNTLQDAPLVLNPVSSVLNRDKSLSVHDKVLACNPPEVDLLQSHAGDQNLRVSDNMHVSVLNKRKEFCSNFSSSLFVGGNGQSCHCLPFIKNIGKRYFHRLSDNSASYSSSF